MHAYGIESVFLIAMLQDDAISDMEFAKILSRLIASNIVLFYEMFQNDFYEWLKRDVQKYLNDDIKCIAVNWDYMSFHFLEPPDFADRVNTFISAAVSESRHFISERAGFCPVNELEFAEYYPFHIVQITRLCLVRHRYQPIAGIFDFEKAVRLLQLGTIAAKAVLRISDQPLTNLPTLMGNFYFPVNAEVTLHRDSLITSEVLKYVYSDMFSNGCDLKALTEYTIFEVQVASFVHRLMIAFLQEILQSLSRDNECLNWKQEMWSYFEELCKSIN